MSDQPSLPQEAAMPPSPSSPAATGGEGPVFEQHVGAYFLGLLLVNGICPCFADACVSEVRLQTKNDGWRTDDILVRVQDSSGVTRNLALQAKLGMTITASETNEECRDVISGAWRDFQNRSLFARDRDIIGLAVARGTSPLLSDFRRLLNCAVATPTSDLFSRRVATHGYLSTRSRKQYDAICSIIRSVESSEVHESEIWCFLRSFRLLHFLFDDSMSQTETAIVNLLAFLATGNEPITSATSAWCELFAICAQGMPNSAVYVRDSLPKALRDRHPAVGPKERGPLRKLLNHGELVLGRISTSLSNGVTIDRADLVSTVLQRLDSCRCLVVTGPAGSGKSAVARRAVDILSTQSYVLAFRAEEFAAAHLDDTLNRAQVPLQATELFQLLSSHDQKVVLVESVERLLEKPERDSFGDLLRLISNDPSWRLVLTCRGYSVDVFCSAFLEQVAATYEVVHVPPLHDDELDAVAQMIPVLKSPMTKQHLRDLFRNPYFLSMAAKMQWSERDPSPTDERAFRQRVWNEIVKKDAYTQDGQPIRRAETFKELAVRRARALVSFVPCNDLDRQMLEKLRSDELIEFCDESCLVAAPAHDVLEDWALLQWIDDTYNLHCNNWDAFLSIVGPHPAVRRAYRKWLDEVLQTQPESALALVTGIAFSDLVEAQARDDTLVSMMLSSHAADCLRQSKDTLVEDDCRLLIRLIHLVRVACMESLTWLPGKAGLPRFLVPKGPSWAVLLEVTLENLDALLPGHGGIVLGLVKDWASSINVYSPTPDGARDAGAIAARLLAYYEKGHQSEEDKVEEILGVILKIPVQCEPIFTALVERACSGGRRDYTADEFSKMLLQDLHSAFAGRCLPHKVIQLAHAKWKLEPTEHDERYGFYGGLDLADVFGLSPHVEHGYFPASAWRGPFMPLLRYHPELGLSFIIELLNYAVDIYAKDTRKKIEPPFEVIVPLADGESTKQWCNDRLWCLYRGSTVGPCLLQSALMALEAWLLEQCELGAEMKAALDSILLRSNNAALTAVVASAAIAYPDIAGECALPLLRCPEFVRFDLVRMVRDLAPVTAAVNAAVPCHPSRQLYNDERTKSDSRPHRKSQLEYLAVQLQAGPLASDVQNIIDEHRRSLPPPEEQAEVDKEWRLALHRMDLREYEIKGELDDGRLLIQAGTAEPDIQKIADESAEGQIPFEMGSGLLNWGMKVFRGGQEGENIREQWREQLNSTIEMAIPSGKEVDPTLARIIGGGISYVASVCVRDHWEELDEFQREWCIGALVEAIKENANSEDYLFAIGRNATDAARPAAMMLPLILSKTVSPDVRKKIRETIVVALTHACYEVMEYAAEGVGAYLWGNNSDFAGACARLCIRRAERANSMDVINRKKRPGERVSYEEVWHAANMQSRKEAEKLEFIDSAPLDQIEISNPHHQREISLLLGILAYPASGEIGQAFMKRLVELLVQTWKDLDSRRGIDRPHTNYELEHLCIRRLARFCLQLQPEAALMLARPVLDVVEALPERVADLVTDLVLEEDHRRSGETFWRVWQAIADKALAAKWVNTLDYRDSDGAKLVDALFLGVDWKAGVRHWEPLQGNWRSVDFLFERLPLTALVMEAYLRYLYHVGEAALPAAITLIERKLCDSRSVGGLLQSNVAFYLDSILRRFVYGRPAQLKSDCRLRESVLRLLDLMVEAGSSSAYLMRDDFVTPLPPKAN